MKRNLILFLGLFVAVSVATMQHVYAYIDPATTSYVIQVIAGIFIAAGSSVIFFWKNIKMWFLKKKNEREEKKIRREAENRK